MIKTNKISTRTDVQLAMLRIFVLYSENHCFYISIDLRSSMR